MRIRSANVLRPLSVLLIALISAVVLESVTRILDSRLHDIIASVRSEIDSSKKRSANAVFVAVDVESEEALDTQADSRMRGHYARLLDILKSSDAKAVVFDFIFAGDEPGLDAALVDAMKRFPAVLAGAPPESEQLSVVESIAQACTALGSLESGIYAGIPRYIVYREGHPAPVSLLAAELHTGIDQSEYRKLFRFDEKAEISRYWIPFDARMSLFPKFSLHEVLESDSVRIADSRKTPRSILSGKTIFVGYDQFDRDQFELPNSYGRTVPGVYGHMFSFEGLVAGSRWRPASQGFRILVLILFFLITTPTLLLRTKWAVLTSRVVVPTVLGIVAIALSSAFYIRIPIVSAIASYIFAIAGLEAFRRRVLNRRLNFAVGFDASVLDRHRTRLSSGQLVRRAAILCADIRNYTDYVKNTPIDEVSMVIGEYMSAMESAITERGGDISTSS